jgi:uncharacterized membrane protein
MNAQQPATSQRQLAENKYKVARGNLLLMIVFTLLNIVLLFTGSDMMLLFIGFRWNYDSCQKIIMKKT